MVDLKHIGRLAWMMAVTGTGEKDACTIVAYGEKRNLFRLQNAFTDDFSLKQGKTITPFRKQLVASGKLRESLVVLPRRDAVYDRKRRENPPKSPTVASGFSGRRLLVAAASVGGSVPAKIRFRSFLSF